MCIESAQMFERAEVLADKKAGDVAETRNGEDGPTPAATWKASAELMGSRNVAES